MKSYSRSAWRRVLLHTVIIQRIVNRSLWYLWKALNDLTGNSSSMAPLFEHLFEVLIFFKVKLFFSHFCLKWNEIKVQLLKFHTSAPLSM